MKDEAIEEIRNTRKMISARFDHDTKAILKYYKDMETKYQDRLLNRDKGAGDESNEEGNND